MLGEFATPAMVLVGSVFLASSITDNIAIVACVGICVGIIGAFVIYRRRKYPAQLPPALVLDDAGIHIHHGSHFTNVPWRELVDVGLTSGGGRHGVMLGIKVQHPEKHLSKLLRLNYIFSRFQIFVPVSGLDCGPTELMENIKEFRRTYA
jgi:hypothetical protein